MRRLLHCVCLFAVLLLLPTPTIAQTNLLGSSTVQSVNDNNSPGQAEAYKATASSSGTVTTCNLYLDSSNTAKTVVFGIYSYSNSHPGALLGSGSISSPIAGTWNTIPISAVPLTANTTYYLALLGVGGTIQYRDGAGTSETSLQTSLTSLPSTWSSGATWNSGNLSAYCSGTAGGTPAVAVSISPTSATVNQGGQQQFTATVTGTTNTAVTWSVKSGTGTIGGSGLYTAPNQAETDVVQVQSQADPTKTATATVTIPGNAVAISLSPSSSVVSQGGQLQFTAAVTNCGSNCAVNWSVASGSGTITQTGLFTAPGRRETDTVQAQAHADLTKTATATVTIPSVSITISPTSATPQQGAQQQFTAIVSGTTNTAVNWTTTGGTISSSGLYTAPNQAGTFSVTATSQAASNRSATATVIVPSNASSISISPTNPVVKEGGTQQFTATMTNCSSNCGVNWSTTGTGTINASGLYSAPNQQETDTVTATAQSDNTKTASTSVTVPAVGITISPTSATVPPNGTQQFTATVSGTVNTGVAWSALLGTVNASGLYTAPSSTGNDTATATASALPNPRASASVTIQNQNQMNCGYTLNWTSSVCQVPASGQLNTAIVNGVNDPNAWTIISRHGEYSQGESECNGPWDVFVANGALDIRAEATSRTCGDFNPSNGAQCSGAGSPCPGSFPYSAGDVQWNTFSYKYGVLITRQKVPSYQTSLWPGSGWLLGTNCQSNNKYTGDTGFDGCPSPGQTGYTEMDVDEFYNAPSGWPQFHIANPGWGCCGGYPSAPIDTNWHVFATVWTSNGVQQYLDGSLQFNTTSTINSNLFYIFQTQTGGVGGTPNNTLLPADLLLDYIKVCNASYTLAQCTAAATDGSDPNVIFWDDFGGPAQ